MSGTGSNAPPEDGAFYPRDRLWHPPALSPGYKSTVLRAPQRAPISFSNTLSEMTGPVFGHAMLGELDNDLILNSAKGGEAAIGERIVVHGRVLDENERPVPNILIEFWQANAAGRYRHKRDGYLGPLDPNFGGCGRAISAEDGSYWLRTIKPGPYPWPNGVNDWRPSHIHFSVFGSGFAQRLITQMYFEGDPLIRLDPILNSIKDPAAIEQLIAPLDMAASIPMDSLSYQFDIVLRGRRSTLFENRLEGN